MNEYINLTLENIDEEHICCAIGAKKHQAGVDSKKEWIKSKLKDGHIFRKLNARGKIFIEYEPIETAWIPISGKNYEYIYCLWVAGNFKGKGIGKELLEYAINDSKEKGKSGICTLVSKKKKPFIGEKKFFEQWVLREAYIKWTGEGLSRDMRTISMDEGSHMLLDMEDGYSGAVWAMNPMEINWKYEDIILG